MKVLRIEPNSEEWLEFRLGKLSGSKAKGSMPLTRGTDRTPKGFWELVAEKVCIRADGESAMNRGHRLEDEALESFANKYGKSVNKDPGVWVHNDHSDLMVSPDGSEDTDKPTWGAEVKCLNSADHLKHVYNDIQAQKSDDYSAIAQVPKDYKYQVLHYFVINEHLQTVYVILYDDRVALDDYVMHVIEVRRDDIEGDIQLAYDTHVATLNKVDRTVKELMDGVL